MYEEIKAGETDNAKLFEKYGGIYGRNYKAVAHCMGLVQKPRAYERTQAPHNAIWFGEAGGGKTWAAEQEAIDQEASLFKVPIAQARKGWFDGYQGEEIILFDDFHGSVMPPEEFLNLLDGLRRLPIKGGYVENKSHTLFFTAPEHPINWWPKWYQKTENNWNQVKRRLQTIFIAQEQTVTEVPIGDCSLYKHFTETIRVTGLETSN